MHQWKLERRPSARVTSHAAICGGVALALFRNSNAHLPSATMNDTYEVVTIAVDRKHFSRYNYRSCNWVSRGEARRDEFRDRVAVRDPETVEYKKSTIRSAAPLLAYSSREIP
ncbi:hypothetical protein BHM03_00055246 [Ensete ventricosum]|nr:hypothetical protein BHM03_00055246 [Ensete ventricosum]